MSGAEEASAHERIDGLVTRMDSVERWMEGFKLQMNNVGEEVRANTRLTEEIHGNTSELVETMADLKTLGRWGKRAAIFSKYVAYVVALFGAAWAFVFPHR